MVLTCVNHMILYKAVKLRSGWHSIFEVLSAAALEKTESIVALGLKLTTTINAEFADFVINQNAYGDLVATVSKYCNNSKFPTISSQAVAILKEGAERFSLSAGSNQDGNQVSPDDGKIWLVTLQNMKEVIISCEMEIRNRYRLLISALTDLFELLVENGGRFSNPLWMVVMDEIILPLFVVIKKKPDSTKPFVKGKGDAWIATTMATALEHLVKLYSTFPVLLKIALEPLLDLLSFCILQENETLAKLGSFCLKQFVENNCEVFEDEMWDAICKTFKDLFSVTLPVELFCEIEGSLDDSKQHGEFKVYPKPTRKQFSPIIMKCILHLGIIQMTHNLIIGDQSTVILSKLHQRHISDLSDILYKSYIFAQLFNENLPLRQYLLKIGFMKTLPNLVKQETTSAAAYLVLLATVYKDISPEREKTVREIEGHLFSLAYSILNMFCKLDAETQQGNINAWEPVVSVIVEVFTNFPDQKFKIIHSYFYDQFVKIMEMRITSAMYSLSIFFQKVGEIHKIAKLDPPFISESKVAQKDASAAETKDAETDDTANQDDVETMDEHAIETLAEEVVKATLKQSVEFLTSESTFIDPFDTK